MPLLRRARSLAARLAYLAGRGAESRLHSLRAAEFAYRTAHRLAPRKAATLFRLGRVREARGDWQGAESAYSAGIALTPPTVSAYLTRRAHVRDRQGRSADAIADCLAAPDVMPPPRLVPRLIEMHRREGRLPAAIDIATRAVERKRTAKLLAALAECYTDMGALGRACRTYRDAVDLAPDNLSIRTDYGRCAGLRSLVPFEVVDGQSAPVSDAARMTALDEALEQFAAVVGGSESRVWAAYWLGRILESHSRFEAAQRSYRMALERVHAVDKPWAHHAEQAWTFREAYVAQRVVGGPRTDARTNRSVQLGSADGDLSDAAGYFEATVTNVGLHVEGFVRHDREGSVEIQLDDTPVLAVSGDTARWQRDFKATIVHNVVDDFPEHSRLTLRVGREPLVTVGGARSVEVDVPDGSGKLAAMLDGGRVITKKGRWADGVVRTGERDDLYFAAYATAKRFFDQVLGRTLFLSYGTLLGCVRDGRLIPGDDDFDVSYVSEATEPEQLKDDGRRVIRALLERGFDCRVAMDGRMFHLRIGSVVLDVNPFWFHAGRAWSFDSHAVDRTVFEPVRTLDVGGEEVYVPGQAEAFLGENYGPDWRVPRSDFQYHRSKADLAVLRRARLLPSEVRDLQAWADELRRTNPSIGRFHGYGDPADPRFGS